MTAFIAWLLSSPTVIVLGGGIIAALGWGFHQRLAGAKAERSKQAVERLAARSEADKIDDAVAGMSDEEVLRRQAQWSRKR